MQWILRNACRGVRVCVDIASGTARALKAIGIQYLSQTFTSLQGQRWSEKLLRGEQKRWRMKVNAVAV